jgi:hypothetical protein
MKVRDLATISRAASPPAVQAALSNLCPYAACCSKSHTHPARQLLGDPVADVVTLCCVRRAGIAKADDQP